MEDIRGGDVDRVDGSVPEVDNSKTNTEIVEPNVGMIFHSTEEIKAFYQKYANVMGFGWKIRNSKKGDDGELNYLMLACTREGSRVSKIPATLKTLPTQVAKCRAKITASKASDDLWSIKSVILDHSHDISPTKSRMYKANKNISLHVKRTIELNDEAGVRISKTFQALVQDAGGYENLPFVEQDVRNYISKERRAIGKEGDAKALVNYFDRMKELNCNFWYDIDFDDQFRVRNIFWADARSRAAYEAFGDVVSFDTTYLTNKYEMPFAAFVGVNHHGQSILLGCGLLSAEDTESFVWLFECWVRCMAGRQPGGIVTDQCKAMQKAIGIALPNTRHRWCLWHIMRKIPDKLKGYAAYKGIKSAMKEAIYDTLTEEEFNEKWCLFVEEFKLEQNEWLSGLFNERHRWIPVFLRKDFWAGLSTTQRSESIHAFFDGYVNSKTSLQQFVKQYDNALRSRAEREFEADFRSMNTTIPCGSNSLIEKQFQAEYTHAKFDEVQAEFRGKMNCGTSIKCVEGIIATYNVLEEVLVGSHVKEALYEVKFNRDNHEVSCQCLLFEFRGIMCRHSLSVLALERVKHVPMKYILARWSKKIKWRHSYIRSSYDVTELKPRSERFDKLCKHFYNVAEVAAESNDASNLLHSALDKFLGDMHGMASSHNQMNATCKDTCSDANMGEGCTDHMIQIRSPSRVARKGRPPSKRKISHSEKVVQKYRKQSINGAKLVVKVS